MKDDRSQEAGMDRGKFDLASIFLFAQAPAAR
jgi:hypothetical protein